MNDETASYVSGIALGAVLGGAGIAAFGPDVLDELLLVSLALAAATLPVFEDVVSHGVIRGDWGDLEPCEDCEGDGNAE